MTIGVIRGKIQTIMSHFEIRKATDRAHTPLLVHIPHSATAVPDPWRSDILLDKASLERELLAMTDRYTDELFAPAALANGGAAFINNLSRLVFDPERFEDDSQEVMSAKGMGAVYMNTSQLRPLRGREFSEAQRESILRDLFRPYAAALEGDVAHQLKRFDRCLLIDAHSFPSQPLPYEDSALSRPDLCIGYDPYHASESLIAALEEIVRDAGWNVGRNTPFAGSYVPLAYYGKDPHVVSVMIEINRKRYMDEATGQRSAGFDEAREMAAQLVEAAVLFEAFRNTLFYSESPGGELCIRVGQTCPALDALLHDSGHETWAYITAYNPHGKAASNDENVRAQSRLEHELGVLGLTFYPGAGKADVGDWAPEPSALILGMSELEAVELGQRYGQAAIVIGVRGEPARLLPLKAALGGR